MSEVAQRIVSSHKEAAKRATEFLTGSRKLKLKQAEALELVARVLGVANWQTLHAMALEGKAPHQAMPVSSPAPAAETTGDAIEHSYAEQLAEFYSKEKGFNDEHPSLLREDWANCDSGSETDHGYWRWVYRRMVEIKSLMPWYRSGYPVVRIARAGGVEMDFDVFMDAWRVHSYDDDCYSTLEVYDSEIEAWTQAASAVVQHVLKTGPWESMTPQEQAGCFALMSLKGERVNAVTLARNGFVAEQGTFKKEMLARHLPYTMEHVVGTAGILADSKAVLAVDASGQVTLTIDETYVEGPYPAESEEGLALLKDAGFK